RRLRRAARRRRPSRHARRLEGSGPAVGAVVMSRRAMRDDSIDLAALGGHPGPAGDPRAEAAPATGNGEEKPLSERPVAEQWERVRKRLRTELGEDVFSSWFARVTFEEADGTSIHLSVPTRFLKSWIQSH